MNSEKLAAMPVVTRPPAPSLSPSGMDIARPDLVLKKRRRRMRWIASTIVVVTAIGIALSQLKPAVPSVDRNLIWIDTVKRGPLLRQVQGTGTLVPENVRWITSRASGRVDRIVLRPGARVEPESIILILLNPEVEQAASQADLQLKVAESELENLDFEMKSTVLTAEATAYAKQAAYNQALADHEADKRLFAKGFITPNEIRRSETSVENALRQNDAEQKRLEFVKKSVAPRLGAKSAAVESLRAQARLRREEADSLQVRAGMSGVLQTTSGEIGTQVSAGTKLARVADPSRLKAEVRVAETQAKDIQIGQVASIDTRNGIVAARVARVDPSVQNGTVTVDFEIDGELPRGARPDLSVDGIVELERLVDVVFSGRPAFGSTQGSVGIFRIEADGIHAQRVAVKLGRSSVNSIEIVSGLNPGDRVILSDMSQWESAERVKLK